PCLGRDDDRRIRAPDDRGRARRAGGSGLVHWPGGAVVSPLITQADRACWQRQAAAELARILEGHPELPCVTWTVGPVGSVLTGRISGLAPAWQVRQAFSAWQLALGLGAGSELPGGGGTSRLHAADRSGEVTIRLTAVVFGEREDA